MLTKEIINKAIAEITVAAGIAPIETDTTHTDPARYLEEMGMTGKQDGNLWTTEIMEQDGQKFQGYIWQHESGESVVATVIF